MCCGGSPKNSPTDLQQKSRRRQFLGFPTNLPWLAKNENPQKKDPKVLLKIVV